MKETATPLREKILQTAVALFIEKGLENVKTRELTTLMGISRSHIYHYFSDWASLCLEACRYFTQQDLHQYQAEISHLPPKECLHSYISNYLPLEPDAVWQLYSAIWHRATVDPSYAALAAELTEQWVALMVSIIHSGIETGVFRRADEQQIARQLGAMLNGYADHLIVFQRDDVRRQALDDIFAFISLVLDKP